MTIESMLSRGLTHKAISAISGASLQEVREVEMKECSKCGVKKPKTEFNRRGSAYRSECRVCSSAIGKQARAKAEEAAKPPSRDSWFDLGLEYRREVYDPYMASNRYLPGVRT